MEHKSIYFNPTISQPLFSLYYRNYSHLHMCLIACDIRGIYFAKYYGGGGDGCWRKPRAWGKKNIRREKENYLKRLKNTSISSVSDPFNFDMDPDPRIRFVK